MPFVSSVRGNFTGTGKRPSFPATGSTGGTITTAGGYRIHTFTTTGASTFGSTLWATFATGFLLLNKLVTKPKMPPDFFLGA